MPRFAANLSMMFNEHAPTERFAAAAQAGFTAVELLFPFAWEPEAVRDLLGQSALKLVLFNICAGDFDAGERGLACQPDRCDDFKRQLEAAVPYVDALRPDFVHVMAGYAPKDVCREEAEETFVRNVALASKTLAPYGTRINIEAINHTSMPGYFLYLQEQAARCIDLVGGAHVGMQFDCFHCQMQEGNVSAKLERFLPLIHHVQIAGAPHRHEPDTGELRYEYIFRMLDELGYAGWVGCEYVPAAGSAEGLAWMHKTQGNEL